MAPLDVALGHCDEILGVLRKRKATSTLGKMSKKKYPVGYKFNKLTVLEYMGSMDKDKNNHCFYKCRCECGKTIYIRTQQINVQKSCGCCTRLQHN